MKLTCPGGGIPSHPPRLIALVVNRLTAMMFRPRTDILNLWVQNILYKLHEKRQLNLCYKYYWMLSRCEKDRKQENDGVTRLGFRKVPLKILMQNFDTISNVWSKVWSTYNVLINDLRDKGLKKLPICLKWCFNDI